MMASIMVPLSVIACVSLLSSVMGGPIDESRDIDQNNLEDGLEERLLARLEEALRETATQAKPDDTDKNGEEKEAVQKLNSDMTKIDITLDSKLIEQRILDCAKGYELIVMNDDGTGNRPDACYLHKMDQELLDSVCKGNGERVQKVYKVKQEINDKDFLSQDGPDSVCKTRPMYMILPIDKRTPKDAPKNKRSCSTYCCSYGWWWGNRHCISQCLSC